MMIALLEDIFVRSGIDVLGIGVLLIILFSIKNSDYLAFRSQKYFLGLVISTLSLLCIEIVTRQVNGTAHAWGGGANSISNALLFALNPLPPFFWLSYLHLQVLDEKAAIPRYLHIYLFLLIVHALFSLSNPLHNLLYTVDSSNYYHRGQCYNITAVFNVSAILIPFIVLPKHRKQLSGRNFLVLLSYPLIALVGALLQFIDYNITAIWSFTALSILLVFINIQSRLVNHDYLTGLANRRQIDNYISRKIAEANPTHSFSLLMIDLDEFKSINDRFGHLVGDKALEITAKIIASTLRKEDFIGRYAGDEFIAVLALTDPVQIEATIKRLKKAAAQFNKRAGKPYAITFSIGYSIYDATNPETVEKLQHRADEHMYQDKKGITL